MTRERDAREAWMSVIRLITTDENQRAGDEAAAASGLSVRQLHALLDIAPDAPLPMKELARMWYCDASNVTSIVDALETAGFVRREASPADRRVKLVVLTPEGARVRERAVDRLAQPPQGMLDLTAAELRSLRSLLAKATGRYEPLK